jgi:hypothetical protein
MREVIRIIELELLHHMRIRKVQSQYQIVHSGDEIVWTDVVAAYNTCKKTYWGRC